MKKHACVACFLLCYFDAEQIYVYDGASVDGCKTSWGRLLCNDRSEAETTRSRSYGTAEWDGIHAGA